MVKPLQRITIGLPVCTALIAGLSIIIRIQAPRSIAGFLLPFLFPVVLLGFGGIFLGAFTRCLSLPSHPGLRFVMPIMLAIFCLAVSLPIGLWLAILAHRFGI